MESLFSLIWVIFIVVTLVNASKRNNKKKERAQQPSMPPFTAQPVSTSAKPADFRQIRDAISTELQSRVQQAQQRPTQPQRPAPAASIATPKVHPHLSMDCDLDDPVGSMDFTSTEGIDPCHDDDLPSRSEPRPGLPSLQEQPGLTLDWTADTLVKSVIMQEVLTRPCQRQRR